MHIKRLTLTQFRNYAELDTTFTRGINCILGPNGAGKTNILDAIHYLALTRGFRSSQDKQATKEGETFFLIHGVAASQEIDYNIQCNFVKGKGKKIIINQKPLKKSSEHIGRIPLVAILPNDTELIVGASAARRRFLDILISQYNSLYLDHLIQYDKIISQRNALLKQFAEQQYVDKEQLELWDMQLFPHGQIIHQERKQFIEDFLPIFSEYFHRIVDQSEDPQIIYKSHVETNTDEEWKQLFADRLLKDRVNLYTTGGVHRDDLTFVIDGQSVKNYGSQGQQKTFVIALKLAQYHLLSLRKRMAPILLLDDIFDKLDEYRLQRIAYLLDQEIQGQVFITDTSQERLSSVFTSSERDVIFFHILENQLTHRTHEKP